MTRAIRTTSGSKRPITRPPSRATRSCSPRSSGCSAIVFKAQRRKYLDALASADRGDHGPLGELLARAILDNLHKFVVPAVAGPSLLAPLPALASERISANALRVAATRGRLNASKAPDGAWRSTRAWVDEYLAQRYEREPQG